MFSCKMQAGALENIVKASQIEIIELRHSLEELRYENIYSAVPELLIF